MTDKAKLRFITNFGQCPVVLLISGRHMENQIAGIYEETRRITSCKFDLCELMVDDWDKLLTPWEVGGCMKNRSFSGKGYELLKQIEDETLPAIDEKLHEHGRIYVAGYSLAGLFSLWALHESNKFDGAVSCSGSLWYPGWDKYMEDASFQRDNYIYLSLGDKESKTKNQYMKNVKKVTEKQYGILQNDRNVKEVVLEWNTGGHFSDVEKRIAKGIGWIVQK